jgi:S1-C subfamily serine protease
MALIPPFFLDCVVAIGLLGRDGKRSYVATGFLYGHLIEPLVGEQKTYAVYLVTNRHVFEGSKRAFLRFNPEGGEPAREYAIDLVDKSGDQTWFAHEEDDVDVAVIGIDVQRLQKESIRFRFFGSDRHTAQRAKAADLGVSEGDGIFLLGFPMGMVGESRNVVVVRQGSIARIRDCLELKSKDFLIDCSVFPGNSGGPVVTRPETIAIVGTKQTNTALLVGIVARYLTYTDVAVSQQTHLARVIFEENSGLASVFPVDYVEDLVQKAMAAAVRPARTDGARADPSET